jgi:hypothetical protein
MAVVNGHVFNKQGSKVPLHVHTKTDSFGKVLFKDETNFSMFTGAVEYLDHPMYVRQNFCLGQCYFALYKDGGSWQYVPLEEEKWWH